MSTSARRSNRSTPCGNESARAGGTTSSTGRSSTGSLRSRALPGGGGHSVSAATARGLHQRGKPAAASARSITARATAGAAAGP